MTARKRTKWHPAATHALPRQHVTERDGMKYDALPTRYPQRMKFTERSVKALKRDPARVEYVVWNADMPCFGVRLRGDSKTYIDQPRVHGRSVKNTIGDVNKISLENATKIARKHFAEARLGILGTDKAKAKAEAAEAKLTLARVAEQYLKAKEGVLSDGTHAAATRYFEKHWGPLLSLPLTGSSAASWQSGCAS